VIGPAAAHDGGTPERSVPASPVTNWPMIPLPRCRHGTCLANGGRPAKHIFTLKPRSSGFCAQREISGARLVPRAVVAAMARLFGGIVYIGLLAVTECA